jgi:hypothetical protein
MVMKKASGGDSPLRQGAGKNFWTLPISRQRRRRLVVCFLEKSSGPRVFSSRGLNRQKGNVRRWTRRSHPLLWSLMSTHASVLVDSVGPPSAEVCRTAASFP